MTQSEEWIVNEDEACREERVKRPAWLVSVTPPDEVWVFHGAPITKYLFEEARYCFTYGQFLATTVLGFAFIEHTLAALFYAYGRNDLERANVSALIDEAFKCGWLTKAEAERLNQIKKVRNPVSHFRKPLHEDSIEYRSVLKDELQYSIIEKDAQDVIRVVFHLISRVAPAM